MHSAAMPQPDISKAALAELSRGEHDLINAATVTNYVRQPVGPHMGAPELVRDLSF